MFSRTKDGFQVYLFIPKCTRTKQYRCLRMAKALPADAKFASVWTCKDRVKLSGVGEMEEPEEMVVAVVMQSFFEGTGC